MKIELSTVDRIFVIHALKFYRREKGVRNDPAIFDEMNGIIDKIRAQEERAFQDQQKVLAELRALKQKPTASAVSKPSDMP